MREKLDPDWHKARIAARILLKAQRRPLNARDKRLARQFAEERGVSDRLIQQGLYGACGGPYVRGKDGVRQLRECYVVDAPN